jgi:signal transduction histidine kinase
VRFRLTLLYASLFLAAGAALLAITYGLAASTIPSRPTPSAAKVAAITAECKQQASEHAKESGSRKPIPERVSAACQEAFVAGAALAASSQRHETLQQLGLFSLLGLGVMTVLSAALGWIMAGRVLRPVRTITDAARRASDRHLGERLNLRGPDDELKLLADTFDDMLDRLDQAFAAQRRFVADASHELRTPLTVMRTAIDVTLAKPDPSPAQLEQMALKVRRYVDQAESLIEALLTLATSEAETPHPVKVDLAELVREALDGIGPSVAALDLRMRADLEPACAAGDPTLLARLVGNLVDNAVRHNERGGWLEVRTDGVEAGDGALLTVANGGPVIPADSVPSLFDPFRRMEERTNVREGVGLGLAIVQSIATAHGASVRAESPPTGGLTVAVVFPAADGR